MRCFLALELDGQAHEAISKLQAELKALGLDATYPKAGQFHVTLCFFGELTEQQIKDKIEALRAASFKSFDASLEGVGFFPSPTFVRVVWVGFKQGRDEIIGLQKSVSGLLDYHEEKFEPHVTLARIRSPRNKEKLAGFAATHAMQFTQFRATKLSLMQSTLSTQGPAYETLFEKKLD